jgi:hypothetical protein
LTGHQALLAWHIRRGEWKGVDVSDMIVAAAVRGTTTLGADDRDKAESVIIVDSRASEKQRKALEDLARELGGKRLNNIKGVRVASMIHFVEDKMDSSAEHEGLSAHHAGPATPRGCFWAEGLAEMNTRPLEATDHVCGNEVIAYQPLSKGVQAQPAYTLVNAFKGKGLDTNWDDHNCRGSFVGHFAY